uniref:RRM domain-containing protein n=1 Tax=Nomascus leucogenys TaxID=61853 RepID=A0A2I3HC68_NOMLE
TAMQAAKRASIQLPPEVNQILYIRNLPYTITANTPETRGTAYVVYEDIFVAKNACDHLSGFNFCDRQLVVLYYNANRAFQKTDTKKEEQLKLLMEKYGCQDRSTKINVFYIFILRAGAVAHICNPSTLRGRSGRIS